MITNKAKNYKERVLISTGEHGALHIIESYTVESEKRLYLLLKTALTNRKLAKQVLKQLESSIDFYESELRFEQLEVKKAARKAKAGQ